MSRITSRPNSVALTLAAAGTLVSQELLGEFAKMTISQDSALGRLGVGARRLVQTYGFNHSDASVLDQIAQWSVESGEDFLLDSDGREGFRTKDPSALSQQREYDAWRAVVAHCDQLEPDLELLDAVKQSVDRFARVVVVTNHYSQDVARVLRALGFGTLIDLGKLEILSPSEIGCLKSPEFYRRVSDRLVPISASDILVVGDNWETDYRASESAGLQPILVESRVQLIETLRVLSVMDMNPFSIARQLDPVIQRLQEGRNDVYVIAVSGDYCAGRKTLADLVMRYLIVHGAGITRFGLSQDSYLKISSEERRALFLRAQSDANLLMKLRTSFDGWWDHKKLIDDLQRIRRRRSVCRVGMYNHQDRGRMTGKVEIAVPRVGPIIIVVDAMLTLHDPLYFGGIDQQWYVRAPLSTRLARAEHRDSSRRTPAESAGYVRFLNQCVGTYFDEHQHLLQAEEGDCVIVSFGNGHYHMLPPPLMRRASWIIHEEVL